MHTEYVDGLVLRPMMDAGYTAWRDGERVGIVQLVEGEVEVDAADEWVRAVLVHRLEADLRAAGIGVAASAARLAPAA
jgi:hypothetical protein